MRAASPAPLHCADYYEPLEGGAGIELCRACGAINRYPRSAADDPA